MNKVIITNVNIIQIISFFNFNKKNLKYIKSFIKVETKNFIIVLFQRCLILH